MGDGPKEFTFRYPFSLLNICTWELFPCCKRPQVVPKQKKAKKKTASKKVAVINKPKVVQFVARASAADDNGQMDLPLAA